MNSRKENRLKIYVDAITTWGIKAQLEMLQEEATELALATRKFIRKATEEREADLAEEIADVEIMIEQIKECAGTDFQKKVGYTKRSKLRRLKNRLAEGRFED